MLLQSRSGGLAQQHHPRSCEWFDVGIIRRHQGDDGLKRAGGGSMFRQL